MVGFVRRFWWIAPLSLAVGCQTPSGLMGLQERLRSWAKQLGASAPVAEVEAPPTIDPGVYQRAEVERSEFFEREVERLRADLRDAEASIVALESGLRNERSRADAISTVAEARVALDRLEHTVPWRPDRVAEAHAKLEEAERQIESGHLGSALFFAARAKRITESLRAEVQQVSQWSDRRSVRGARVNLRTGPSLDYEVIRVLPGSTPVFRERQIGDWALVRVPDGRVGWIHAGLIEAAPAPPAAPAD